MAGNTDRKEPRADPHAPVGLCASVGRAHRSHTPARAEDLSVKWSVHGRAFHPPSPVVRIQRTHSKPVPYERSLRELPASSQVPPQHWDWQELGWLTVNLSQPAVEAGPGGSAAAVGQRAREETDSRLSVQVETSGIPPLHTAGCMAQCFHVFSHLLGPHMTAPGRHAPACWLASETGASFQGLKSLKSVTFSSSPSPSPNSRYLRGTVIALCRCVLLIAARGVLL